MESIDYIDFCLTEAHNSNNDYKSYRFKSLQ